jgi:uncharacterized protein YihD (DUF1040 family)
MYAGGDDLLLLTTPALLLKGHPCYFVRFLQSKDNVMNSHRVKELIALLQPAWEKDADLNLLQFLQKLAQESGFQGELSDLTDDTLIYHLKMRDSDQSEAIPGLKKDYEEDFKTAILRARGVIKE